MIDKTAYESYYNWVKNNISIQDLQNEGLDSITISCPIQDLSKLKGVTKNCKIIFSPEILLYTKRRYIKENNDGTEENIRKLGALIGLRGASINRLVREIIYKPKQKKIVITSTTRLKPLFERETNSILGFNSLNMFESKC